MKDFEVDPQQYNNACYIVAGGPSLKGFDWSKLRGQFVIAINRSYEVLPDAQIIYFTDAPFWENHKDAMIAHKGQMIRGALAPGREPKHPDLIIYKLSGPQGLDKTPGQLKHGSNSPYAATNLAIAHLGFKRVYLLGVDMKWGEKGNKATTHWHDGHPRIDPESGYQNMIKNWKTMVEPLKEFNAEVWNANPNSGLNCFPKCTIERALANKPLKIA